MRSSLCLVVLPLLAAGCVSNTDSGPTDEDAGQIIEDSSIPVITEDAGQPARDATVPMDSAVEDSAAPPVDAADAAPAPVTVLVTNDVGPEPGITIVFHDPTGAATGTATTGATGTVTQLLAANSQITAIMQGAAGTYFVTVQGVQPGDALTVFDSTNLTFASSTVDVTGLPDSPPAGTVSYNAYVGNQETSGQGLPLSIGGIGFPAELQGKSPVLVLALDAGFAEVGYTYATGIALPPDGGNAEVSLATAQWSTDETAPSFALSNIPSVTDAGVSGNYTGLEIDYAEISGNVPYDQNQSGQLPADEDAGYVATFTGHPSYPDSLQVEGIVRQQLSDYTYATARSVATRMTADASVEGGVIDMSQSLPQLTYSAINADDAGTATQPIVTWTSASSLASTDGIVVVAFFSLAVPDGGGVDSFPWAIVVPPTATSATTPAIPASIGTPTAFINQYEPPTVLAVEASYLAGYAQMRAAVGSVVPTLNTLSVSAEQLNDSYSGPIAPTLPVDGTLRLTTITASGD